MEIGIIGNVYPKIKSSAVSGVVYNLCNNELPLSLEIKVAENRDINARPKTVIPGVKC